MRLRSLLAGAAMVMGILFISVPAALASTAYGQQQPGWQPTITTWHAPEGDQMCTSPRQWDHETDGNCCQQQENFPWLGGEKIAPILWGCGFPKPPVCHEVTTWTESWGWRHHHVVPVWHRHETLVCDNQGKHCQTVSVFVDSKGGLTTDAMLTDGQALTEFGGSFIPTGFTETVGNYHNTHPLATLTLSPKLNPEYDNNIVDFRTGCT